MNKIYMSKTCLIFRKLVLRSNYSLRKRFKKVNILLFVINMAAVKDGGQFSQPFNGFWF